MGGLVSRETGLPELTVQQGKLVAAIVAGKSIEEAGALAAYADYGRTMIAVRCEPVKFALQRARQTSIETVLGVRALETLNELLRPGNPPGVRLKAATWVLEAGGHGPKTGATVEKDKPPHEMTESELVAFIHRAEATIAAGGTGPIITVVPDNGALPPALSGGEPQET